MTIKEIKEILDAEVLCGTDGLNSEIHSACGSDMMSDVLAFVSDQSALITGLCNPQVIRTAQMLDIKCVIFVRGKKPDNIIIEMAEAKGITVLCSPYRMYSACGMLYSAGLKPKESRV